MQYKLHGIRKSKDINMKPEDMAKLLNIHTNTYRDKENSKTAFTLDEMFLIAECFNMDLQDIFTPRA